MTTLTPMSTSASSTIDESRRLAGFAAAGRRVVAAFRAWRLHRSLGSLACLDDHMLRDIGLTRSDLHDAAATPLWSDPSHILALRARERRRYRAGGLAGRVTDAPPLAPGIDAESSRLFPARSRYY